MSKDSQKTKNQSEESFSLIEDAYNKYFVDVEQSIPRFQHEFFNLQNEYYKAWKNLVQENILLQKEIASKTEFFRLSEPVQSIIKNINEEISKARVLRDNIAIATAEAMKNNIRIWNDNAEILAEYNKKILQFWLSASSPDFKI